MREWLSVGIWLAAFFGFELPAKDVLGWAPWYSLSKTTETGAAWWWPIAIWLVLFILVLLGHFEPATHFRVRWVVTVAVLGVCLVASHLIRRLV